MSKDKLIKVGTYTKLNNDILEVKYDELDIVRSSGLIGHLIKRKHFTALKYIDYISDIIKNPDYIGINPNEKDISYEIVKRYNEDVMLGIKLERSKEYYYVSTIHLISQKDIDTYLRIGRLKKYIDNNNASTYNDNKEENILDEPE